jgi:hypothetical protein
MFYDAKRIVEDADVENVAEYLDMEMSRSGSVIRIKCPGHFKRLGKEDNNFGSCMLTERGYYCFACQKAVDVIEMVEEFKNCSYIEALETIADANGGREQYVVNGKIEDIPLENKVKVLSNEDLEIIGLKSNIGFDEFQFIDGDKNYIKNCHFNLMPDMNDLDADYFVASKTKTVSIKNLKIKNEQLYNTIVKNAAKKAMDRYLDAEEKFAKGGEKIDLLEPFGKTDEVIYDFKQKFNQLYRRAKEIYDEIDDSSCIDALLDKEPERVIIPKYDLFD